MFCVLDIEATNAQVGEERIIEIAIYKFDGNSTIDQFISLVNPEVEINRTVQRITGITNKMVRTAPKFYEVAKRILEITKNSILVGHNVPFDYRMLKQEFQRLGYTEFEHSIIDTLPLSKKLFPDEESHSLGKLCKSLGIPITKRHRASGDAKATLELFQILKSKDSYQDILRGIEKETVTKRKKQKASLTNQQKEMIDKLPTEIGVFYCLNDKGDIIFIGKNRNIRQGVNQLFISNNRRLVALRKQTKKVKFERTGTYLIALLKQLNEVNQIKPSFNRVSQKSKSYFGLFIDQKVDDYSKIFIDKFVDLKQKPIGLFSEKEVGLDFLLHLKKTNQLIDSTSESVEDYNQRFAKWAKELPILKEDYMIYGKGNKIDNQSFILLKDGEVKGYGFYEFDYQISNLSKRKKRLIPVKETFEIRYQVLKHLNSIKKATS